MVTDKERKLYSFACLISNLGLKQILSLNIYLISVDSQPHTTSCARSLLFPTSTRLSVFCTPTTVLVPHMPYIPYLPFFLRYNSDLFWISFECLS